MTEKLNEMINNIIKSLNPLKDALKPYQDINKELVYRVFDLSKSLNEIFKPIQSDYYRELTSNIYKMYFERFNELKESIDGMSSRYMKLMEQCIEIMNKDYISIEDLYNLLAEMYWCFPYGMEIYKVQEALAECSNEKELDQYLLEYYDEEKVDEMINFALEKIKNKFDDNILNMFEESVFTFKHDKYNIADIGFIYVFEGCTTFFLKNKCETNKKRLFNELYYKALNNKEKYSDDLLNLKIMNKFVQILYSSHNENEKEIIKNHRSQRHIDAHGRGVNKYKVDNIRLINSICELLRLIDVFSEYENKIIIKKNKKNKSKYKNNKTRKKVTTC